MLGLTFLTKETVILLFPLWAVAWLLFPPYDKSMLLVAGASVVALVATLLPWLAVLHFIVGDVSLILGENVNQSGTFDNFLSEAFSGPVKFVTLMTSRFLNFFAHYFTGQAGEIVAGMSAYGWIVLAALPVLVVRAVVRRTRRDVFVLAALVFYIPFMIYLGWATYDHRQSAVIFAIAALSVAGASDELIRLAKRLTSDRLPGFLTPERLVVAVFLLLGTTLAAATPSFDGRFTGTYHAHTFYLPGRDAFRPTGALSPNLVDATDWIAPAMPVGKRRS